MDKEPIELSLKPAPDDPRVNDPKFQEELREFSKSLRIAGVTFSQRSRTFDAIDAQGYALAEFAVKMLVPAAIGAVTAVCVAWVQVRSGRKLRIKIGDVEAEGQTTKEIENLLKQAADFRDSNHSKDEKV